MFKFCKSCTELYENFPCSDCCKRAASLSLTSLARDLAIAEAAQASARDAHGLATGRTRQIQSLFDGAVNRIRSAARKAQPR